jgi:acyl-CoA synthetase (AMP-forming)/AMP-acid ligase II
MNYDSHLQELLEEGLWDLHGPDATPVGQRPEVRTDGLPPGEGKFIVPHYQAFASIVNAVSRTYRFTYDEARKHSDTDALAIRRDPVVWDAVRTRQMPTVQLSWHLEPVNEMDPAQLNAVKVLTDVLKDIPRFQTLKLQLMEAIWFGRYGVQLRFGWDWSRGYKRLIIVDHRPIHGEKLVFKWGGNVGVRVSAYYTVPSCPADERAPIPIGRACGGEELLVLDERLQPVYRGETGDLYIRGVGLSPGYWQDVEKTQAVFVPNPHGTEAGDRMYKTGDLARVDENGLVYFLGRSDSQIKSRGYRIELGEIEAALSTLPNLQASAVVAVETDGFEGKIICAAYVRAPGTAVTAKELSADLAKRLPNYMIPSRWHELEAMPLTFNGKVDKRKLTELFLEMGSGQKRSPTTAQNVASERSA